MSNRLGLSIAFYSFASATKLRHSSSSFDEASAGESSGKSYGRDDEIVKCVSKVMSSKSEVDSRRAYDECVKQVDELVRTDLIPKCESSLIDREAYDEGAAKMRCESDPWAHIVDDRVCPAEPFKPVTESLAGGLVKTFQHELKALEDLLASASLSRPSTLSSTTLDLQSAGLLLANGVVSVVMIEMCKELGKRNFPELMTMTAQNFGAVGGTLIVLLTGWSKMKDVQSHHFLPVLIQGALSVLTITSSLFGYSAVPTVLMTLATNSRPIFSAMLEAYFYQKEFTNLQLLGLAVISGGVAWYASPLFASFMRFKDVTVFKQLAIAFANPVLIAVSGVYDQSSMMKPVREEQTEIGRSAYKLVVAGILASAFHYAGIAPKKELRPSDPGLFADLSTRALIAGSSALCLGQGVFNVFLDNLNFTSTSKQVSNVASKTGWLFLPTWMTKAKALNWKMDQAGVVSAVTSAIGVALFGYSTPQKPKK